MEPEWIKFYTSTDFFKCEMVRQALIDNNIEAIILDKQGFPYRIGEVEVYIHGDNFESAIEVVIKNEL